MAQEYAKKFYNSKAWEDCREGFMQSKCYICERCGGVATIAHHKEHITQCNISNPDITLNWDNLKAVCHDCHNVIHGNGCATAVGVSFDSNGNIIYTPCNESISIH